MAQEVDENEEKDEHCNETSSDGKPMQDNEEEEDDDEEEEEDEPRLNYTSLTKNLRPLYRNGDATSAFVAGGDKMIIGTHNGNIHVLSLPTFQSIRVYHAHSASISALSMSPFPPPLPVTKPDAVHRLTIEHRTFSAQSVSHTKDSSPNSRTPKQPAVSITSSNSIYIGSASIDGNVCIASLVDPKDVQLRNFGRPVKSVGLSPDYKSNRSYLSGGLAGNLVLTTGGQVGKSSVSNTTGGGGSTSGWLGAIGLGSNTGKDQVLHSGEGAISTIKWSLSGMYVAWVNEKGIKIMRSNLHLEAGEADFSWKRISHTDHPNSSAWDEMAGVWKAHVEWIDEDGLESDNDHAEPNGKIETSQTPAGEFSFIRNPLKATPRNQRIEKVVVGWSSTIWIMNVYPRSLGIGNEKKAGRVEVVTILRTDCVISGLSLYTPNLLIVLAYVTPEEDESASNETAPRRSIHRRKNALQPEMRIIDVRTKEEVCGADTLNVNRFESLSATDYHLGVLPAIHLSNTVASRGALEVIGGGIWDATMYPTRLFSSGASVLSGGTPSEPGSFRAPSELNTATGLSAYDIDNQTNPVTLTLGMKIFIHSPYDCVLATKTTLTDHLSWLTTHEKYESAWNLIDRHPEAVNSDNLESAPDTPTKAPGSLGEFFEDDSSQTTTSARRDVNSQVEQHKRAIGEKWIQQLVTAENWAKAGQTCGKVLGTSSSWEHWVWVFAEARKYEEITPYIPTTHLRPPLKSVVYEMILGHYISVDRLQFQELLKMWSPDLFDANSVIEAIQGRLRGGDIKEYSIEGGETGRDWRILMHGLAKLYLADGHPRQALRCYIQLQDADTAMDLIAEYHLIDAVSDDIPSFILLRVAKSQQKSAPVSELEEATLEPIRLLVNEAYHGIVPPETVISQLERRGNMQHYLFFYFRALWNGHTSISLMDHPPARAPTILASSNTLPHAERLAASEGKALVSDHADLAVSLFASYDRPLLMTFLKASQSYNLEQASQICKQRSFIPECVYLLSKEGRLTQALRLIIDNLNDVSQAIAFCKEQNDQSLWDDLLDYSMNKPRFIRGLLEEVGTAINPISLVRRIPAGLEIEGLREGLSRMIREYEIQYSISEGVARVLHGEVAAAMATRGSGQKKALRFDIVKSAHPARPHSRHAGGDHTPTPGDAPKQQKPKPPHPAMVKPGYCPGCGKPLADEETQFLIGFVCTHVFHLRCLLRYGKPPASSPSSVVPSTINTIGEEGKEEDDEDDETIPSALADMARGETPRLEFERSVGPKIDRAALLRTVLGEGCPVTRHADTNVNAATSAGGGGGSGGAAHER